MASHHVDLNLLGGDHKPKAQTSVRRSARLSQTRACRVAPLYSFPRSKATTLPSVKRKRADEVEDLIDENSSLHLRKRQRKPAGFTFNTELAREATAHGTSSQVESVCHWLEKGTWPKEYFGWGVMASDRFLARQKSTTSLRRKRSDTGSITEHSNTPSDQKAREVKSKPYQNVRYKDLLAVRGSYMDESKLGITDKSKKLCRQLLEESQSVPQDSLFRDDLFASTCRAVQDRNEARILRDITPLLVPSAESLAIYGATDLGNLIESINEGWNNSEPVTDTRPQPDYALGFRRDTFTKDQLAKLSPYIGDYIRGDHSLFMGTYNMYFPFFTCEVKCGATALDIADRQNAHSMTLAVRSIVTLFTLANRQQELHREILAFSVSHDHRSVRIHGHYPHIEENETTYYRHLVYSFDFMALDGEKKWTTYQFTKNVYKKWLPIHLARIRSAIDDIPDFRGSQLPEGSSISQGMESHHLSQSFTEANSLAEWRSSQSNAVGAVDLTPDTSFSAAQGTFKKPKKTSKPKR